MVRRRFAGLVVLAILGMLAPSAAHAQESAPTAVIVTPPSPDGCDDIAQYVVELEGVRMATRALWQSSFPGTTFPNDMSDDEFVSFLAALSPEELIVFAEVFSEGARLNSAIEAPAVSKDFHHTRIAGAEVASTMFRHAATLGVTPAFALYSDQLTRLEDLEDAQGTAALAVCPAFQQVLEHHADDNGGTAEAG
jgi:hypothetical protein